MDSYFTESREQEFLKKNLFTKDFTLVVIGQIISLFGNQIIRYAIPLYLLNETGSAALYGMVLALSFLPMLFMAPIGGIIADRVNKRNVMVGLDLATAILIFVYSQIRGSFGLVPLLVMTLMILYAIQGAYSPAVQGAIPALVDGENLMSANAVINGVSSISGIAGPVLGGILFSLFGLQPILLIGSVCFLLSSIMEVFIRIPFEKRRCEDGIFKIVKNDMKDSFHFITKEKTEIGKMVLIAAGINLVLSALIIVGYPVVITQHLDFAKEVASRLQGIAEGAMAFGTLFGAMIAGALSKKLKLKNIGIWFLATSLMLLPMGIVMLMHVKGMPAFLVLAGAAFLMMTASTVLNIELITYVQMIAPKNMIAKVMSLIMCLCMCASPLGQLMYGMLFEVFSGQIGFIFLAATVLSLILTYYCGKVVRGIEIE